MSPTRLAFADQDFMVGDYDNYFDPYFHQLGFHPAR